MHVEDHPLEYGDFERIIPEGEYAGERCSFGIKDRGSQSMMPVRDIGMGVSSSTVL